MKKGDGQIFSVVLRYFILLMLAIPGVDLFYYLFLPLTKYPIFWGLQLFYDPSMLGYVIFIGSKSIEIVGACVAGSAYFFLLILAMSVPKIKPIKRIKIIFASFGILFLINVLRIYILAIMYIEGSRIFDLTHKLFWYLGSTIFVVVIWFVCVYLFRIKGIPFYDDIKLLYKKSSLNK